MAEKAEQLSFKQHALIWGGMWLLLWAIWFLFVAKFEWPEAIVGVFAAAIAAAASHVVWAHHLVHFAGHVGGLLKLWRLPWAILKDAVMIFGALARRLFRGQPIDAGLRAIHFEAGGDDPSSAARRALALVVGTATPNTVIIGIDREKNLLIYHQLTPGDPPFLSERLGKSR